MRSVLSVDWMWNSVSAPLMAVKELDDELYEILAGWWSSRALIAPMWEILPRGYVSFIGGKPIFAGFLYKNGE